MCVPVEDELAGGGEDVGRSALVETPGGEGEHCEELEGGGEWWEGVDLLEFGGGDFC